MSSFYDDVTAAVQELYDENGAVVQCILPVVDNSATPWKTDDVETVVDAQAMFLPPVGTNFGNRCLKEGLITRDGLMILVIADADGTDFMKTKVVLKDGLRYTVKMIDTMYKGPSILYYEMACSR